MADGFDYLPYIRPLPDDWLFMALQEFRDLREAGGYRFRYHVTKLTTGPGIDAGNIQGLIDSDANAYYSDQVLQCKPGTLVYAVLIYQLLSTNKDWINQHQTPALELELIDAQTNETWWRSSQNAGDLAYQPQTDAIWFQNVVAAGNVSDRQQMGQSLWFILGGREVMGDGEVMVRMTDNKTPFSVNGNVAFLPSPWQVSLMCAEPLISGGAR